MPRHSTKKALHKALYEWQVKIHPVAGNVPTSIDITPLHVFIMLDVLKTFPYGVSESKLFSAFSAALSKRDIKDQGHLTNGSMRTEAKKFHHILSRLLPINRDILDGFRAINIIPSLLGGWYICVDYLPSSTFRILQEFKSNLCKEITVEETDQYVKIFRMNMRNGISKLSLYTPIVNKPVITLHTQQKMSTSALYTHECLDDGDDDSDDITDMHIPMEMVLEKIEEHTIYFNFTDASSLYAAEELGLM